MTERGPHAEGEDYRIVNLAERQGNLIGASRPKPPPKLGKAGLQRAGRRFRDLFYEANQAGVNDPNKADGEAIDNEPALSQELDRDIAGLATIILEFFGQWKQQ